MIPTRWSGSMVALLFAQPATSSTIRVPEDEPTVRTALALAAPGDTVLIASGTYHEHALDLVSDIVLRGETGAAAEGVVLDGDGAGPVLRCVDLSAGPKILDLTVQGGAAPPGVGNGGGAMHCTRASPVLERCRFRTNSAEAGGGVACYDSAPRFSQCQFLDNDATSTYWAAGGGIYALDSTVTLDDCLLEANTATSTTLPGDGGGIFSQRSFVKAERCTLRANTAGAGGGGWYSFDADQPTITDCSFEGNEARAGGAAYLEHSFARIDGTGFAGNTAANGGALFVDEWSAPTVTGCRFERNTAHPYSGGAVDVWQSSPLFDRCGFLDNAADLDGGALVCHGLSTVSLRDCTLLGNRAFRYGGGVRTSFASSVQILSCTLAANTAAGGGGIFHEHSGPLSLVRSVVAFSVAGAAAVCADTSRILPSCSDLWGNGGGDWTGCLAGRDGVDGNLAADPWFCDLPGGDVRVRVPESPCLPENNSCGQRLGAGVAGCGIGTGAAEAFLARSWGRIKSEFR